jgi:hypothetical protein
MSGYKRKTSREPRMTFSDLTVHARPLVKSIADTCKDLGIICGTLYAAFEMIGRVWAALV